MPTPSRAPFRRDGRFHEQTDTPDARDKLIVTPLGLGQFTFEVVQRAGRLQLPNTESKQFREPPFRREELMWCHRASHADRVE